jgi:hypothetical protein
VEPDSHCRVVARAREERARLAVDGLYTERLLVDECLQPCGLSVTAYIREAFCQELLSKGLEGKTGKGWAIIVVEPSLGFFCSFPPVRMHPRLYGIVLPILLCLPCNFLLAQDTQELARFVLNDISRAMHGIHTE